ncbi:MAG: type II secretion system F domain [Parcubacteria group bacterium Gr01-1014_20]|nr:MAG: type II secretion system F domain [Parcubacteria group bacterium Gr01-1014_20]
MFAKRLSILVKAGIPLLEGVKMLKNSATSRAAIAIYSQIVSDVERGKFLASSLESLKHVFGDFAVNVIRVGEMSGTLEGNLNYLAEELKKKQELKRKVVGALIYPAIVVTATIALSILLTAFIFPKIMPIFDSFKFELPFTTRALIFVSGVFLKYGIYILLGFVALVVLFIFLHRLPKFRMAIDGFILKIPIFGRLAQSIIWPIFAARWDSFSKAKSWWLRRRGLPVILSATAFTGERFMRSRKAF